MPGTRIELAPAALDFVTERHLAILATHARDGSIHGVPVGFTWDAEAGLVRIITGGGSQKVANIRRDGTATVSQVDGRHWISLSGTADISSDADVVADAVERYSRRYRQPRENPERVAILLRVEKVLGSSDMLGVPPLS